jgi:hypothetical protein
MKMTESNRAIFIMVFIMVAFNGIFLSVNGLFMLIAPLVWYDFVPGVIDTGLLNQPFIRDIGIIQLFLGVAFGVGMIRPDRRMGCGPPRPCGSSPMPFSTCGKLPSVSALHR